MKEKKERISPLKIIGAASLGAALLFCSFYTVPKAFSKEDKACLEQAYEMEQYTKELGFPGFTVKDYPIAFCDGQKDYVTTWENGEMKMQERKAVLDSFAATAYKVEDHFEVIVPAKKLMSGLVSLMGQSWDEDAQARAIWHEGFHCYQMTNYEDSAKALLGEYGFGEDFGEKTGVEQYEAHPEAVALFEEQSKLLYDAIFAEDESVVLKNMKKYKELDEERMALFDPESGMQELENYYTVIEGTAQYVEAFFGKKQDETVYTTNYLNMLCDYVAGNGKYYKRGMAQALLLDKLDADWKSDYDFSVPMIELIYENLGL